MMTGKDPSFPFNLKPWSGNFIQPGDATRGVDGVLAVRSELFVDRFLLEKLGPIVCTYVQVLDEQDHLPMKTEAKVGAFTPKKSSEPAGGTFSTSSRGQSHKTHTIGNDDAVYSFSFDVDLSIDSGGNTIVIKRHTTFSTQVTEARPEHPVDEAAPGAAEDETTGAVRAALPVAADHVVLRDPGHEPPGLREVELTVRVGVEDPA